MLTAVSVPESVADGTLPGREASDDTGDRGTSRGSSCAS